MAEVRREQDDISNDMMLMDAEMKNEESTQLEEAHVINDDSAHSNGRLAVNKDSLQMEDANVENKLCLLPHHNPNPIETSRLRLEKNLDHPDVSSLELPKEGSLLEVKRFIEPSICDPGNNASPNKPQDGNGKFDRMHLNPLIQSDSIMPIERSVETQAEDEMELKTGSAGFALDADIGLKEDELNYPETRVEVLPENETKDQESNSMELNVGVTELAFSPNIEAKEEKLHDEMTGTEFPSDNKIEESNMAVTGQEVLTGSEMKEEFPNAELDVGDAIEVKSSNKSFVSESNDMDDELGTEEVQAAFMRELETFHKERFLEFKPPRFYGEPLNCLKLWRAVIRLGGYEQVTSCKFWRQVGESFKPPKTCTTVSWTFRCFYEKALLEYEKHKMRSGELPFTDACFAEPTNAGNQQPGMHQASGPGRARRDAAARAMQGWHSQRLLGNGEVGDPIIKDKNSTSTPRREKQLKSIGLLKRKRPSPVERAVKIVRLRASKSQSDTMVVDIGTSADWVKINVQRTKDCYEVYALVPGLLREEVRVQSDPAGRLVISGEPEQLDNPWGVSPFKKVVSLPSRIDPHQTSAVVTLHGQLFVRVPFEQSDM